MCPVCIASTAVIVAGAGSAGGILAVCIGDIGKRAVQSSILDFEGGCVLVDAIAARSLGRTGREGACSLGRAREHRYDSKPQHPEGLSGIRCAGHPQWNGEGEEDIFPDPMSEGIAEGWHSGVAKALERQFAAYTPESMAR